jgi:hypothetical protein
MSGAPQNLSQHCEEVKNLDLSGLELRPLSRRDGRQASHQLRHDGSVEDLPLLDLNPLLLLSLKIM